VDVPKEFRTGVRAALLVLKDEEIAAEQRIGQATEMLFSLPVPMPHSPHEDVMPTREILYVTDADGMPVRWSISLGLIHSYANLISGGGDSSYHRGRTLAQC
jgi:hypothetical protein